MTHSTQHLYNIEPVLLKTMNYEKALKYKVEEAKKLIKDILLVPHFTERDDSRINDVYKAIKFNESLLEELQC